MVDLLKKLMFTSGVSGREEKIREAIKNEVEAYCDEAYVDNLGNLIAHKKGNGKKIMLCAHLDEIGFFVTNIDEKGFIHISPIGGINFLSAVFSEVVSENGVHGVLVPSSKGDCMPKAEETYIDIGAKDKKSAEKKVSVGDYFTLEPKIRRLQGNRYIGRPFDDRVGCAILIEAIKSIKKPQNDLYFVFSTQEEVGGRGSKPATYSISPDIGIAIDVTGTDKPGSEPINVKLGGGCTIKIKDSGVICSHDVVEKMRQIAKDAKIKYQDEILPYGGTDASPMQIAGKGARVGVISIPTAFIHTGVEMIDMYDVKEAVKLTIQLCNKF